MHVLCYILYCMLIICKYNTIIMDYIFLIFITIYYSTYNYFCFLFAGSSRKSLCF